MKTTKRVVVAGIAIAFLCVVCSALVMHNARGTWPDSWPKEMELLRQRATSFGVAHGIQENVYEIPFADRAEFEAYWPIILTLKSKGAPLTIDKSPSTCVTSGSTMTTGVRILWPCDGTVTLPDGTKLDAKAPWPDAIKSESGDLPEYVVIEEGKWAAHRSQPKPTFRYRARVDIVLVTDGQVIDLNHIPLPPNTPIIDRRFGK